MSAARQFIVDLRYEQKFTVISVEFLLFLTLVIPLYISYNKTNVLCGEFNIISRNTGEYQGRCIRYGISNLFCSIFANIKSI
ncbi:hypothetical protein Desdi_2560 [Desulfitobacterium dichloroeliminans LMG P-21439]|uniref:Uncharacterized protein n=1 Tax=Desulfitobacterium dichloroeliminans (strain LMG P-21439 / DCA1) TaxID=871963 RepID=L0FBE6_DESDL|nr:hypothetical protein Desdi_2560 [Desulfitobacterium dichloroeliminans LMG P-21439]